MTPALPGARPMIRRAGQRASCACWEPTVRRSINRRCRTGKRLRRLSQGDVRDEVLTLGLGPSSSAMMNMISATTVTISIGIAKPSGWVAAHAGRLWRQPRARQ